MVHKQSEANLQRKTARRYVLEHAFQDRIIAEDVNLADSTAITAHLQEKFSLVVCSATNYDVGEVVVDSRGQGSLQT